MIFLAVTMGFVAENIRENISNKKQENEYARSMISDLENDVTMYNNFDLYSLEYCNMVDTIITSLKHNSPHTGKIYYLARRLTMLGSAAPSLNAKTYLQMTSTGAFRLIKHQRIADSIALYYQLMKSFDSWSDLERSRVNSIISVNDKLFNADVFFSLYKAIKSKSDSLQQIVNGNPAFLTNDVHDINSVKMQYQYYYGFLKLMVGRDSIASVQAKKLMALLEREYDITEGNHSLNLIFIQTKLNGSTSSPTRREKIFQRIFLCVLIDISCSNHWIFADISGRILMMKTR